MKLGRQTSFTHRKFDSNEEYYKDEWNKINYCWNTVVANVKI